MIAPFSTFCLSDLSFSFCHPRGPTPGNLSHNPVNDLTYETESFNILEWLDELDLARHQCSFPNAQIRCALISFSFL
ncbi:hypothetical protein CPB83DRAFT_848760 [Crepidotus variabilis]|uniref:Uncharacterized protein n=1 Tax=Crepidotus variabilis TaxID=179855 RepID=A0A9P6JSB9_9AGAR|nr:hypothetical protein CPB83DRAFT_848760 [Crepidotus variabilis]